MTARQLLFFSIFLTIVCRSVLCFHLNCKKWLFGWLTGIWCLPSILDTSIGYKFVYTCTILRVYVACCLCLCVRACVRDCVCSFFLMFCCSDAAEYGNSITIRFTHSNNNNDTIINHNGKNESVA